MSFDPYCGGKAFSWYHEYPIVSVEGREIYTITFPDTLDSNSTATAKLDRKIIHINGQPSMEFLLKMSQTLPDLDQYFDPDARWNRLMVNYPLKDNAFANRTLWAGEEEEKLQLTFEGGEEVTVEWNAILVHDVSGTRFTGFTDTATFVQTVCYLRSAYYKAYSPAIAGPLYKEDPSGETFSSMLSSLSRDASSTATSGAPENTLPVTITEISDTNPTITTTTTDIPESTSTTSLTGYPIPLFRGPGDTLIFFPDPDSSPFVAVLRVPTFDLEVATLESFQQWDEFFNNSLTSLAESGVKILLIDVSDNPGGDSILGKRAVRMLFPESFRGIGHEPTYYQQWRYHPALAKMFKAETTPSTLFDENEFIDLKGRNFSSINDILGPYYNSQVRDYFTAIGIPRSDLLTPEDAGDFPRKNFWRTEDVVVVSNDHCSSTCHFLVELLEQRTYAIGGRPGHHTMQAVGGTKT